MNALAILFVMYSTAAGPQVEVGAFETMAQCEAVRAAIPSLIAKADVGVTAISAVCSPVVPFGVPV